MLVCLVDREDHLDAEHVGILREVHSRDGADLHAGEAHRRAALQPVGLRHQQLVVDLADPDPLLAADVEDGDGEDEGRQQHDDADRGVSGYVLPHVALAAPPTCRNSCSRGSRLILASSTLPTKRSSPSLRKAIRSPTVKALWMSCVTTTEV